MNTSALRIAAAALLVVVGIWAGAKIHFTREAALKSRSVPVAAGEASAPNPSDLAHAPEGAGLDAALPPPKIPDRLPQFSLADRTGKATSIAAFEGKSLIINFWATWCAPCRMVAPLLDQLALEYEGKAKVAKVDVDLNIKTSTKFNVRSIPAILFFKDGKLVDQVIGFVGKPALAEKFKQHAA